MRAILKRDFRAYFSSPLGYVFVAGFTLVLNLYFFTSNVYTASNNLESTFYFIVYMLIFLVPILTMRTFSEEYKQKTDQLLLTAPVRPFSIVMGKFLSALGVFTIAMLFTLLYALVIGLSGTLNGATTIGNYVAIYAVATTYISIGVFISSLTENQLISCIVTLGIFLGLYMFDSLYEIVNSVLAKNIIYWFSLFRRFQSFASGIFSFADLIYYLSVSAVFIFLTVRVLEKKRWS